MNVIKRFGLSGRILNCNFSTDFLDMNPIDHLKMIKMDSVIQNDHNVATHKYCIHTISCGINKQAGEALGYPKMVAISDILIKMDLMIRSEKPDYALRKYNECCRVIKDVLSLKKSIGTAVEELNLLAQNAGKIKLHSAENDFKRQDILAISSNLKIVAERYRNFLSHVESKVETKTN